MRNGKEVQPVSLDDDAPDNDNPTGANEADSSAWRHIEHLATLLGMGLSFPSLFILPLLIFVRRCNFFDVDVQGIWRMNLTQLSRGLLFPYILFETVSHLLHTTEEKKGRKSRWQYFSRAVLPRVVGYACVEILSGAGVDIYWTGLGVLATALCAFASKYRLGAKKRDLLDECITIVFLILYTIIILPTFSASSSQTRLVIVAVVHPILSFGINTYFRLRDATGHPAPPHIILGTFMRHVNIQSYLAFARRMMLLNVGDARTTIIAIAVCIVEDIIVRCFDVDSDAAIAKALRLVPSAHMLRAVWMSDACLQSVCEFVALLVAPILCIGVQSQYLALNLGYDMNLLGRRPSNVSLFINLLLQLCAEAGLCIAAAWTKGKRGISVIVGPSKIRSYNTLIAAIMGIISSEFLVIYGFVRRANFVLCNSSRPCACLDTAHIREAYLNVCDDYDFPKNITTFEDPFEGVDPTVLMVSLLAGAGMLAVVALSVYIARNRRNSIKIHAFHKKQEELKEQYQIAFQSLVEEMMLKEQTKKQYLLLQPYSVPQSHIVLNTMIGSGAMGDVWLGECRGRTVAVKRLKNDDFASAEASARDFRKECNIMANLQKNGQSHENLVQMMFVCWDKDLLLVLDFCELGGLDDVLKTCLDESTRNLTWNNTDDGAGALLLWSRAIASGMEFMHSHSPPIIHRDLKTQNILLKGAPDARPTDWIPKIADFGESREFDKNDEGMNLSMVGSPFFVCPEIIMCEEYDETCDVFSFGVLLFDMATYDRGGVKASLWGRKRYSQVNVVKGMRPKIPDGSPPWLQELIASCWSPRSEERPSFPSICAHFDSKITAKNVSEDKEQSGNVVECASPTLLHEDIFKRVPPSVKKKRTVKRGSSVSIAPMVLGNVKNASPITSSSLPNAAIRDSPLRDTSFEQSPTLQRALLTTKIMGYSLLLSIFLILMLILWSNNIVFLKDTVTSPDRVNIQNFLVYDSSRDFINFILIAFLTYGFSTVTNVAQFDPILYPQAGPRRSLVTLALTIFLPCVFYGAYRALPSTYDARYSLLNMLLLVLYIAVFICLDVLFRNLWLEKTRTVKNDKAKAGDTRTKSMKTNALVQVVQISVMLINIGFTIVYLVYVLPVYFGSSTTTRMYICLIIHPLAVECNELLSRISMTHQASKKDDISVAKEKILSNSQTAFGGKYFLSLSRRLMLLNLGEASATMTAIVFTSFEEAVLRAFLVEMDTTVGKWLGKPKLEGRSLELQQFVWSIDINQSSIAELVAIIVSTFAYILFEPHALAINFGYDPNETLLGGLIFMQLLFELLIEIFVDVAALWAESEHGIPVSAYFKYTKSTYVLLFHTAIICCATTVAIYSVARYPNALTCNSAFVCSCMEQPAYSKWYNDTCHRLQLTNDTALSKDVLPENNSIFEAIDLSLLFKAVSIVIGAVSFIFLVLQYFRKKKSDKRVESARKRVAMLQPSLKLDFRMQAKVDLMISDDDDDETALLNAYEVPHDHISYDECIHKGARGEIWLGKLNGMQATIKKIYLSEENLINIVTRFKHECEIMARMQSSDGVSHRNIVQMVGCCWKRSLRLLLDYYPLGSLRDVLAISEGNRGMYGEELSWGNVFMRLALGTCDGLNFMHQLSIIHGDVRLENIIIDAKYNDLPSKWSARISDFGAASLAFSTSSEPSFALEGTNNMMMIAPEIFTSEHAIGTSVDVYAFGICLLCIAACVEGSSLAELWDNAFSITRAAQGDRPHLTPLLSDGQPLEGIGSLIASCWATHPRDRPSFSFLKERLEKIQL